MRQRNSYAGAGKSTKARSRERAVAIMLRFPRLANAADALAESDTDFKSIKSGQRWIVEIQRALDDAKYFLIVVGPKNQIGEWQDREWQGALQRTWTDPSKRIIPVLIDDATAPSFLKDWVFVRTQPDQPESSWIDVIYETVRGAGAGRQSALAKQSAKPDKALRARLEEIEGAARQLKSSQE
jgi:hypothetical protein